MQMYGVIGRFVQRLSSRLESDFLVSDAVEAAGIMVRLVCTLSQCSGRVLDDFESSNGYGLLETLLLTAQRSQTSMRQSAAEDSLTILVHLLLSLIFPANSNLSKSPFQLLKGTGSGLKVSNPRPFDSLISSFLVSESHELRRMILETIVDVYASHRENYNILHCPDPSKKSGQPKSRGISAIIDKLESFEEDLAETALQTVLHLITVLGCRPEQELLALGRLLASEPSLQIQVLALQRARCSPIRA